MIGTFFRTGIRVHYTWILAFVLIPWAVSTQYSTETSLVMRIGLGVATALMFFITMFLREIALLALAVYKGVVVRTITIFAFGGLIQIDHETTTPQHETLLAVSGMLLNLVITGIFYFVHLGVVNKDVALLDVPLKWLAFFFFTLGMFHIIPGFPLEGGRILHAILWKKMNNIRRATRVAGVIGWIVGFLVMVGGILLIVLTAERFTGMFFTGLGLILQNASTHGIRHMKYLAVPVPPAPEEETDTESLFVEEEDSEEIPVPEEESGQEPAAIEDEPGQESPATEEEPSPPPA